MALRPSEIAEFAARGIALFARHCGTLIDAHRPSPGHEVPGDFVGICIASAPDAACDAFVIDRLREMGVSHVRLDYTYGSDARHTVRFLDRLLDESFTVLLHLVQPPDEAMEMHEPAAQERWGAFVEATLERWGDRIGAVEVGSTINRRKWAFYTPTSFLTAWKIAHDIARRRGVTLVGPNVTDFEPTYNTFYLQRMRTAGTLPDAHTTNLFIERAVEPERFDHKIFGHTLAPLFKFNLIKKARYLHRISESTGVRHTWSTHVAWSRRRIDRVLPDVEEKQADYLARYYLLAAASGALSRVYWGPMIGQREGVVDDGTNHYPTTLPHVTLYEHVHGEVDGFRVRPALHAMKTMSRLVPGAQYLGALCEVHGLEAHAFSKDGRLVHALWTMDGRGADPEALYEPEDLAAASWMSRDGAALDSAPVMISESPVYASWPADRRVKLKSRPAPIAGVVVRESAMLYRDGEWRGVIAAASARERDQLLSALAPGRVKERSRLETLRQARNTVWRIEDPRHPDESVVVKRWLLKPPHKRVLDAFKPSKARRSWNGANELLRRGISTPRPVAFFEHAKWGVLKENFYVCAFTPGGLTVRSFFTAYAAGDRVFEGVRDTEFYEQYSDFLLNMHKRGVHYRDLAPGNILVERGDAGELRFSMVDTARARFYERPATLRQSLADLKRTCHPLDWEGRKAFVGLYLEKRGEEFTALRRLPFALYDIKQRLKQRWKRLRRRIAGRVSTAGGFGAIVATEYGQLACEFAMTGAAMVGV